MFGLKLYKHALRVLFLCSLLLMLWHTEQRARTDKMFYLRMTRRGSSFNGTERKTISAYKGFQRKPDRSVEILPEKPRQEKTKQIDQVGLGEVGDANFNKKRSTEKLLRILKQPDIIRITAEQRNMKDSSRAAIKNGMAEPLSEDEPVILVWWPPAYLNKVEFLEREFQGVCGKCRLTTDRSTFNRSTVILFDNVPNKTNLEDLPSTISRRKEQAYVLWHRETPAKTYHLRDFMQGAFDTMFNYTLSYRRDADITWYLGNAELAKHSIPASYHKNQAEFVEKVVGAKRHLAVWMVSNCANTQGAVARKAFVDQLVEAGLDVDLYGSCYNKIIPHDSSFYKFLLPYKFYLAFENSWHCKDYLTEKFWRNGLMANVVPVIWGPSPEDVAAVAPPHSYIHSEDFASPGELVKYLNYLDNNDTAYREYFDWRLEPITYDMPIQMLRTGYEAAMCKICRVLNENSGRLPGNIVLSALNWVFIDDDAGNKCLHSDLE